MRAPTSPCKPVIDPVANVVEEISDAVAVLALAGFALGARVDVVSSAFEHEKVFVSARGLFEQPLVVSDAAVATHR